MGKETFDTARKNLSLRHDEKLHVIISNMTVRRSKTWCDSAHFCRLKCMYVTVELNNATTGWNLAFIFMKNFERRHFCRKSFFKWLQNFWTGRGRYVLIKLWSHRLRSSPPLTCFKSPESIMTIPCVIIAGQDSKVQKITKNRQKSTFFSDFYKFSENFPAVNW